MAVGITSYGSYVPYRRLKRAAIAQVLGIPAGKGERAVASFDEDSVSMAVEAARDALRLADGASIDTLLFATTTPPYADKLAAALVGAAVRLPAELRAADSTGSVRATARNASRLASTAMDTLSRRSSRPRARPCRRRCRAPARLRAISDGDRGRTTRTR